jgi:hypothetical protein
MPVRPVDLRGALIADCARGRLHDRDSTPLLAIPVAGLSSALAHGGGAVISALAGAVGESLVGPAREALGSSLEEHSPDDVAYGLNVALARAGLGRVDFERWGDALLARWHDAPAVTGPLAELCAGALAAFLTALTGLEIAAAALSEGDALRVLLSSPSACAHAIALTREGLPLASVLADLQPGDAS